MRKDVLCSSLAGNDLPLMTVTSEGSLEEVGDRDVILMCARVHPGESNSSWIMQGNFMIAQDRVRSAELLQALDQKDYSYSFFVDSFDRI